MIAPNQFVPIARVPIYVVRKVLSHLLQSQGPFRLHCIFLWLLPFPSSSFPAGLMPQYWHLPLQENHWKENVLFSQGSLFSLTNTYIYSYKSIFKMYKTIFIFSIKDISSSSYLRRCSVSKLPSAKTEEECHIYIIPTHAAPLPNVYSLKCLHEDQALIFFYCSSFPT